MATNLYVLTLPDGTEVCRNCDYTTESCKCES